MHCYLGIYTGDVELTTELKLSFLLFIFCNGIFYIVKFLLFDDWLVFNLILEIDFAVLSFLSVDISFFINELSF